MSARSLRSALLGACIALNASAPSTLYAEGEPGPAASGYSPYEQASIDEATARLGSRVDADPEGKVVEGVDIVTLDVIEPRDPAPGVLNLLHATTRRYVIEREVLMNRGDPYRRFLCDESARRNLRSLPQLSLVICTATAGSSPDRVRVLVITKDVWSLRMGWDLSFIGGGLESLQLVPTETNLGGTHQIVLARYVYRPESQSLALGYRIPRLAGTRIGLAAESGIIWNRDGHAEGSSGALAAGSPLYSAFTEWSWAATTRWRDEVIRRYRNAQLAYDPNGVPWEYRTRQAAEGGYVTRSFGSTIKNDFTLGAEMNIRVFLPPELPGGANASARDDYRSLGPSPQAIASFTASYIPTSDTRVGPFVQYRSYTSNFLRVLDFETLGLQEDFRLGHDVALRIYPISEALGSSRTFLGTYAAAQYTVPLGDGLARASIESTVEAERHRTSDGSIEADLRIVTPRLGFGRLVFDAGALNRYSNYMNRTSYLGGSGRLRGYPSNFFAGKDVVVYNLEFRSRPVEILSCQLGAAAFYDVGHAANGFGRLRPRQSVGFGFRILFPQLDRVVFRGDLGFPVNPGLDRISPLTASVAFEQAFSMPSIASRVGSSSGVGWLGQD